MAHKGQVLVNPVSGERFTFRATGSEASGQLLAFDLELTPDGAVPGPHVHPHQEERFEVVAGEMSFLKGARSVTARAGTRSSSLRARFIASRTWVERRRTSGSRCARP